jgi:hypothetical protein
MSLVVRGIISLAMIVLSVFSVIGLVYLTRFSFKAQSQTLEVDLPAFGLNKSSSVACVDGITETDLKFCKVTVVLLWIQIVLSFILALLQSMSKK